MNKYLIYGERGVAITTVLTFYDRCGNSALAPSKFGGGGDG